MKKKFLFVLIIIILIAFIPRFLMVFSNKPFTDEAGWDLLIAKKIIYNHVYPLAGFNMNYKWHIMKGPGWYYTLALPVLLGGGSLIIAKIFMAIVQFFTVIASFFILKKTFSLKTAFISSFLLSISPWFLDQSSLIWPPFIAPLFIVLFLLSIINFLKGEKKFFILSLFLIGIIYQYETAIAIFLLGQIVIFSIFWFKQKLLNFKIILYSIFAFLITQLPIIIYEFTHNFYSTRGFYILFTELLNGGEISSFAKLYQRIDTFVWGFRSTFAPNVLVSICIFALLIYSSYFFLKGKNKIWEERFLIFLISAPFLKFIFSFFYPGVAMAWHYLDLIIIYCFTVGILFPRIKDIKFRNFSYLILFCLFILFCLRINNLYKNEIKFYFDNENVKQAVVVKNIINDANGQAFRYKVDSVASLTSDFDYLFWYYGKNMGIDNFDKGSLYFIKQDLKTREYTIKKED